jgi:hypothetical protein
LSDFLIGGNVYFGQRSPGTIGFASASVPARGAFGVADTNSDGRSDLLVGLVDGSAVRIYLGTQAGISAIPATTLVTPSGPGVTFGFPTIGDINGDGWLDLALSTGNLSNESGRLFTYTGTPAGLSVTSSQFLAPGVGWNLRPDFNADGFADYVVPTANSVQVFAGSASGLPATPTYNFRQSGDGEVPCASPGSALNLGDVNGDGFSDLGVVLCQASDTQATVTVFTYVGSPLGLQSVPERTLSQQATIQPGASGSSYAVGVGDLNGDGFSDVLFGYPAAAVALVMPGDASLNRHVPVFPAVPAGSVGFPASAGSVGDINGDGFGDLVVTDSQSAYVYLGANPLAPDPTTRQIPLAVTIPCSGPCQLGGFGDINGDGLSDFIVSGNVYLGQMAPPGISKTPIPLPAAGPTAVADLNYSGAFDVVVGQPTGSGASTVNLFLSGGSAGLPPLPGLTLASPDGPGAGFAQRLSIVGDINGDGWLDAAVWATNVNWVHIYLGAFGGFASTPAQTFAWDSNIGLTPASPWNTIDVVASTQSGASNSCNGTTTQTGLASSGTSVFGPDPNQDWRYVLALLYGGLDITTGVVDCGQPARVALVNNWSNFFQNGCANGATVCGDATHLAAGDGAHVPLWHAFRLGDESEASVVLASLLGLSSPNRSPAPSASANYGFGASPYCNAMNWDVSQANENCQSGAAPHSQLLGPGGVPDPIDPTHRAPPPNTWGANALGTSNVSAWDVMPTQMQDNDPIRRPCLGASVGNPNRPGEEVCNLDGALGLVLPIVDSSWIEGQSSNGGPALEQYPTRFCNGSFAPSRAPQVYNCPPRGPQKHDGECPNGDAEIAGACLVPFDSVSGRSDCVNSSSQTPTMHVRPTIHNHGRVYNLFLTDGTIGSYRRVGFAQYPIPGSSLTVDMAGAFNRIHQVETVFGPADPPGVGCQQIDPTTQVGCFVQADPCSIGYAGDTARTWSASPGSDAIRVGQQYPTSAQYPLVCAANVSCQE